MADPLPLAGDSAPPAGEPGPDEPVAARVDDARLRHDELRGLLQLIVLLQVAVLIGVVVVFSQFDGLPQRVADRVPSDSGGVASDVYQVQVTLDALTTNVDALIDAVDELQRAVASGQAATPSVQP